MTSAAAQKEDTAKAANIVPFVPREFVVAPFFAADKQPADAEPREIIVDGKKWQIGVNEPSTGVASPALDIRHGRACFALLSFRDRI